jgi:probable phosphoglycerate mutase
MTNLHANTFIFLRHGETDWNKQGLTQGRTEVPLNANGQVQAEAAARRLVGIGITRIVCSTLGRAHTTAVTVGDLLKLPVAEDPDLREALFGDQEGKPMGSWYDQWVTGTYTPTGGEAFADLRERVIPAVNRAIAEPGLALVVGHGAMFRAIRAAMGLSPTVRTDNGVPLRCVPGEPWTLEPV